MTIRDPDQGSRDLLGEPGTLDLLDDGQCRDLRQDLGVLDLLADQGTRDAIHLGAPLIGPLGQDLPVAIPLTRSGGVARVRRHE